MAIHLTNSTLAFECKGQRLPSIRRWTATHPGSIRPINLSNLNYDGFRKLAAQQFHEIYVVDLKGDARTSGEPRRQEGANIFENAIKVGVAISFFVKKAGSKSCTIRYAGVRDYAKLEEKKSFISRKSISDIPFTIIKPDNKYNWLGQSENDWDAFLPLASKETKGASSPTRERAIFKQYSLGISTNRDEWLYDLNREQLAEKAKLLTQTFSDTPRTADTFPTTIKWSRNLKRRLAQGRQEEFSASRIRRANYRPFVPRWLYQSDLFIDEVGLLDSMFPVGRQNVSICFNDKGSRTGICILAVNGPADLHFGAAIDAYQQVAKYSYNGEGDQIENLTDWSLRQFQRAYGVNGTLSPTRLTRDDGLESADAKLPKVRSAPTHGKRLLQKDDIFSYVYAVLHDPVYRERYALNLKREYPRIPFNTDFWKWVSWGERLASLHLDYEAIEPWSLFVEPIPQTGRKSSAVLKAEKDSGMILLDGTSRLVGIPPEAWRYSLGNRSALEWVLDQYKRKASKDPIIREKFKPVNSEDHKDEIISLIGRVCRVSVETMSIIDEIRNTER
jgi:predicted helicase